MTQLNIVLFSGKVLNCLEQVDMKNLFEINYFLNKNWFQLVIFSEYRIIWKQNYNLKSKLKHTVG